MSDKKLKVTLVRSRSKANKAQEKVLVGLNLRKTNTTRLVEDTPAVRGMIDKVSHLVHVEPA